MYGNILNNTQIEQLVKNKQITIRPYSFDKLRLAHYPLTAAGVFGVGEINKNGKRAYPARANFKVDDECVLEPNEYAIVEINEYIQLEAGLFGHFVPASILIDQGFGLTVGKIDAGYGNLDGKTQQIRFGLKNLRDCKNVLSAGQKIAHIYFVDLRGLNNIDSDLTKEEIEFLIQRYPRLKRARDAGVDYGDGSK